MKNLNPRCIAFQNPGRSRFAGLTFLTAALIPWLILEMGCGTNPPASDSHEPHWTRQSARTVDGGCIVYISTGEDRKAEVAMFKGEASAIQDVANECSFAPKGTRIEDRYNQTIDGLSRYFVKIAVSFDDCDAAKGAVTPKSIHKLANAQLAAQLKKYEELVNSEAHGELNKPTNTAASAGQGVAVSPDFSESTAQSSALLNGTAGPGVINTQDEYFASRQQIVTMKEVVILSPPSAFPPNAPQTTVFVERVTPVTTQVQTFERMHPEVRTWSQSYTRHNDFGGAHGMGGRGRGFGGGERGGMGHGGSFRGFGRRGRR